MTQAERLVWAAVFAKEYNLKGRAPYVNHDASLVAVWEANQVVHAVEEAGCAVDYLRESTDGVKNVFGEDSVIYKRLMEMVEE